jgi:hypothetical protein
MSLKHDLVRSFDNLQRNNGRPPSDELGAQGPFVDLADARLG